MIKLLSTGAVASVSLLCMPGLALAQTAAAPAPVAAPAAAPAVAALPVATPQTSGAVLRVGTEVPLKLSQELTTKGKKLKLGQRFQMETTEPVMVQGATVIPAGSIAVGEITEVRNKGGWGKSGHFTAQILYVTVNGRQIRLTGTFDDKGHVGTAAVVGTVLAAPLLVAPFMGFFVTGTSAKLAAGTPVKGFVNEEIALSIGGSDQPALAVSAPAAPAAAPAVETTAGTAPATPTPASTTVK